MTKSNRGDWAVIGREGRDFYRTDGTVCDLTRAGGSIREAAIAAQPKSLIIDLNKTAIIVVDMQNDFCSPGGFLATLGVDVKPMTAICPAIQKTTSALRRAGVPVIWLNWGVREDRTNLSPGTLHSFNPTGTGSGLGDPLLSASGGARLGEASKVLTKGSWGAAIVPELKAERADIHVDKHRISGFLDTPLDSILRNFNIRTIVFAGVNADECVLATLMDANFHGYDTVLLEDGVATSSPGFCMDATVYNVRFCFGFTTTSEAIVQGFAV